MIGNQETLKRRVSVTRRNRRHEQLVVYCIQVSIWLNASSLEVILEAPLAPNETVLESMSGEKNEYADSAGNWWDIDVTVDFIMRVLGGKKEYERFFFRFRTEARRWWTGIEKILMQKCTVPLKHRLCSLPVSNDNMIPYLTLCSLISH